MNILNIVRKYANQVVKIILFLVIIYIIWGLYNNVYAPIYINQDIMVASSKYITPEKTVNTTLDNIKTKQESSIDISNINNPFRAADIESTEIISSEENDLELSDDLGLGEPN